MSSNKETVAILEDWRVNTKLKLSALWVAVMLCYIYGDILQFYIPGMVDEIQKGNMGFEGPTTQGKMLGGAIMMSIPGIMVFLSLVLKSEVNRITNIILGILFTLIMLITMLMGGWAYYMYLGVIEMIMTMSVAWFAWKWPHTGN